MFVHAKKFQATNACTSCGKCAVICPLNNIHLKNGTPVLGKKLAPTAWPASTAVPTQAIEYGNHNKNPPPLHLDPKSI